MMTAAQTPASVVLPSVEWTDACQEVCDQLGSADELLIVCDSPSDPVASRSEHLPVNATVVVAGEPEGCSGKANAVVAGMQAARHDRIVWTDDDFHHPPDWLDALRSDYERQGPTTEVPVFVGCDPLAYLLEPLYAHSTMGVSAGTAPWGGSLVFDRADVDEDGLYSELGRTISDDATIGNHVDFAATERTRRVEVGGTIRETLERHVRFVQIAWRHGRAGLAVSVGAWSILTAAFLLYPVQGFVVTTLFYTAIYAKFGIRRWTALLAYPWFVAGVPLFLYALARRTFVWGARRYRWRSMFDVEIVE